LQFITYFIFSAKRDIYENSTRTSLRNNAIENHILIIRNLFQKLR